MPFNGLGQFIPLSSPTYPAVANQVIYAANFNAVINDIIAGLGQCITKDGQSAVSNNIPMGGFKLTGLSAGTLTGHALVYGQSAASLTSLDITGTLTALTQTTGDSSTKVATTAFVQANAIAGGLASPPPIGNVTPNSGAFKLVSAWGNSAPAALNVVIGSFNTMPTSSSGAGSQNVAIGDMALASAGASAKVNTAVGAGALLFSTGSYNLAIGNASGAFISTGDYNTYLGGYNGNQGGLDFRTLSNKVVLSDGAGNVVLHAQGTTQAVTIPGALSAAGVQATGGAFAVGSFYKTAVSGLVVAAATGSSTDFLLAGPGAATIMAVPTGTVNVSLVGKATAASATAIPAGGSNTVGLCVSSTANFGVFFGSGVPTLSAAKGSLYLRSDGSSTSTRMYVNTDGATAWTNVVTAA